MLTVPASVRDALGQEVSEGLVEMFTLYHRLTSERFERRLAEEIAALRLEFHRDLNGLHRTMVDVRADMFKWALMFWIAQFAAVIGALSYMLPR
jgi:hypothetical protein